MHALESFSLTGRTALVTGASRGIGRAIAQALGEAGAQVAVTSRTLASAQRVAAELEEQGIRTYGVSLEVSDADDVERCVDEVARRFGEIDVLVNNAGISIGAPAFDARDEDWRAVFATNVDGTWFCSRTVGERMSRRGGGTIVNVGSMSAQIVNQPRWHASYLASKAAVHQLTRGLAAEWAPHGIRVNAIAPGYILTEMSPVDQPEFRETCVEPAAMKRWGEPHELGPAVVFLASAASSFMTGEIVTIDGGFTLF